MNEDELNIGAEVETKDDDAQELLVNVLQCLLAPPERLNRYYKRVHVYCYRCLAWCSGVQSYDAQVRFGPVGCCPSCLALIPFGEEHDVAKFTEFMGR